MNESTKYWGSSDNNFQVTEIHSCRNLIQRWTTWLYECQCITSASFTLWYMHLRQVLCGTSCIQMGNSTTDCTVKVINLKYEADPLIWFLQACIHYFLYQIQSLLTYCTDSEPNIYKYRVFHMITNSSGVPNCINLFVVFMFHLRRRNDKQQFFSPNLNISPSGFWVLL
jgi:hypothetical protein